MLLDIPLGYLFNPTDEELVSHYLYNKIHGLPLCMEGLIEEMNVYSQEPWLLPHKNDPILRDNEWYYFVRRTKVSVTQCGGKNPRRALEGNINGGWWKANGGDKPVTAKDGRIIGYKKTLTFMSQKKRKRNREEANKSDWIMHEYLLASDSFQVLVLCRIRYKSKDVFHPLNANPLASQTNKRQNVATSGTEGSTKEDSRYMRLESRVDPQTTGISTYGIPTVLLGESAAAAQNVANEGPKTQQRHQDCSVEPTLSVRNLEANDELEEEIGEIPLDEEYLNSNNFLSGGNENHFDVSKFFNFDV